MDKSRLLSVARGDTPADLLLKNARIVNVFTGEIEKGNTAIAEGMIAGIGDYQSANEIIDLNDRFLAPGFIDGHVHLESSMLSPSQYTRAVVPRGTSAIVTDLHEIANVSGIEGIKYVVDSIRPLPMDIFLMAPSCVPATHLETSGANLDAETLRQVTAWDEYTGIGEVMNYPGVIGADPTVLDKITISGGKATDGHAPGVSGKALNAYIAAGIYSDHESVTLEEAREKLRLGMVVMIREGSSEKNLEALLPLVNDNTYKRCIFVVDDRNCVDLLEDGDIDAVIRKAISLGLDPVRAVQMATINTAEYFRLVGHGAIAPGYHANLVVLDDLDSVTISDVFFQGKKVASDGKPLFEDVSTGEYTLTSTMHIKPYSVDSFRMKASGETFPVIEIVPGQIITNHKTARIKAENGYVVPDTENDILKAAVVERHHATGNIGIGLVKGFGIRKGALASSVAHDSHNIVVVGTSDEDIFTAVKEIERLGGGLAAVADGKVLESLPLPIAGLLSDQPLETVVDKMSNVEKAALSLGTGLSSPFSTLSFIALPVIPELRLTDMGLVDVLEFKILE
ncbi:MAG: adenine deaminase [Dehalococcoidales bacterium]|nr:adenine deaminase [Dehalococcoidales bacterium]